MERVAACLVRQPGRRDIVHAATSPGGGGIQLSTGFTKIIKDSWTPLSPTTNRVAVHPRDVNSQESIRGARWRAFELALPAVLFWLEIAPFRRAGSLRHKDRLVAQGLRLLVSKRLQGCSRQRRRPPRKLQRGLTQKRPQYVLGAYLALRVTPIFSLKSGPSGASAIDNILPQEHFWKIHWQ